MNAAHIHPMIVHFPIVLLLSLAVFDLIAGFLGYNLAGGAVGNVSGGLSVLGGASAVIAYIFGGMALDIAEAGGFHSEIAEIHEGLGTAVAAAFGIWALLRAFAWWRGLNLSGAAGRIVPLIETAGAILVLATAWYGGQLVYTLGVNVAHGG